MGYTVYKHTAPNGKVYIGITSRNPKVRWNYGSGYSTQMFGRAIKKYGWDNIKHEVLFENLSEAEASEKEKELIKLYRSCEYDYGYNLNYGGTFGNCITDSGRKAISDSKMKAVCQYDESGDLINTFNSIKEASVKLGINHSHISECCLQRKNIKQVGGFYWRYKEDNFVLPIRNPSGRPAISVAQYGLDGKLIKIHKSIADARRETGARHIRRVLIGENETSGGFIWKEVAQ